MEKAKKDGKIRFTGISTHTNEPEVIHAATDSKVYDVILTSYNFKQKHYARGEKGHCQSLLRRVLELSE